MLRAAPKQLARSKLFGAKIEDGGKLPFKTPFKQHRRTAVARRKAYHGVPCRGETRPGVRVGDPCVVPEGGRGRGTDLCTRRARAEARTRTLSYAYVQVRHDRWVDFPAECKGHFRASVVGRRPTRPVRISLLHSAENPGRQALGGHLQRQEPPQGEPCGERLSAVGWPALGASNEPMRQNVQEPRGPC